MTESMQDRIAQLERWGLRIRELSDQVLGTGALARFDDLLHVDELKVLHAIAQTRFDAFRVATGPERTVLEIKMQDAWIDLAAAFDRCRDCLRGD